ncbi:MAG TPA: glycosyltransferase [Anaerolineaceae bacterium]|nr:glycosyltransferase [Anaerolineaceae bacterium]
MDHPGGVQSCVYSLIRGLNRRGVVPDILWDIEPDWSHLTRLNLKAGFQKIHFRMPTQWITRFPNTLRYLLWIFNGYQGDPFHAQYDFFYLFYNGFFLSADVPHLRYLSGPPLIPELNNSTPGLRGAPYRLFRWLYQNYLRRWSPVYEFHQESLYVINSEFTARLFEQAHGVQLPIIHPPIDLSGRDFQPFDWSTRDTITYFSRFINYKRPHLVLKLAQRYPNMRCVLMGSVPENRKGYFEKLHRQARQMGLRNVVFLANPTNQRVREELARTRFYIFPAKNEHFGMTTPEAIASGAIPYVHNSGGQIEIVTNELLRFDDENYFENFNTIYSLDDLELEKIRSSLVAHVHSYAENIYIAKMLAYLDSPKGEDLAELTPNVEKSKSNGKSHSRVFES